MEALRVLVVEQTEEIGLELRGIAASLGHSAIVAVDGEEALGYLHALPFDAIVAEYGLPDMDAITLLGRVRTEWSQIPMVMLTTDAAGGHALEAYERGVCDVLRKPVAAPWLAIAFQRVAEQLELIQLREATVVSPQQLAYRFAHAINNPLSVMFGLVQLMLGSDELPPSLREDVQMLADNTLRLTQIVKNLTQMAVVDDL
ncbi:MAG: response regulator [Herpetosiphonaceae bacterium]|nr:response regulator [Herpetosiphonaceae bacterium]